MKVTKNFETLLKNDCEFGPNTRRLLYETMTFPSALKRHKMFAKKVLDAEQLERT